MIVRRTSFIARLFKEDDEPIISIANTRVSVQIGDPLTLTAKIISPVRGTTNFTNVPANWTPAENVDPSVLATGTSNIKVTWQFLSDGSWVDLKTCSAETNPEFYPHSNSTIGEDDKRESSYAPATGILKYSIRVLRNEDLGASDDQYRVYVQGSVVGEVTYPYKWKTVSVNIAEDLED
jgi:hypothetical protein